MCLFRRNIPDLDPKTRRTWAYANLCLFTSIALAACVDPTWCRHPELLLGLRGFLLGLALVFFVRLGRRMRALRARS